MSAMRERPKIQLVAKFKRRPQAVTISMSVVAKDSQRMTMANKKIMTASFAVIPGYANGDRGNDQKSNKAVVASPANQQPQKKFVPFHFINYQFF